MTCPFCKQREADLLCDGKLDDGRICNNSMCSGCAKCDTKMFLCGRGRGSGLHTVDRCPVCVAAGRKSSWSGLSAGQEAALDEQMGLRSVPKPVVEKGQMGFDFGG